MESAVPQKPGAMKREQWVNKIEFFLAGLGYCIGQTALTRFPYIAMKNGGGVFLIPFIISLAIATGPICYLEILLGQFSGHSPLALWSLCPAFKGIGYSVTLVALTYVPMYMAYPWATYYFYSSMTLGDVPWKTCGNDWNSPYCQRSDSANQTILNATSATSATSNQVVHSASEEFWNYHVLGINAIGLDNIGQIQPHLAITNLFCWATIFLCTMKGALSAGKVVYVTATLPFILIVTLMIRGVTLEGSWQGLVFFLKPDFSALLDINVWLEAGIQAFYQSGNGWGALITLASYNHFHRRCYRDAMTLLLLNVFFSILGGMAVFSVFGFMAHKYGVHIEDVVSSGPGLAFVAYPEGLAQMPLPQFWSLAFFLTLMSVGIDSMFGSFDILISGLLDVFPKLRRKQILTTAIGAILMYIWSLLYCTEGGMYLYQLFDWYAFMFTQTVGCFLEVVVVCYIYGIKRFSSDITLMMGSPPNKIISFCWLFTAPVFTLGLLIAMVLKLERPHYGFTNYSYPDWAVYLGWGVGLVSFSSIPLNIIYEIIKTPGTLKERICKSLKPDKHWVPNCPDQVDKYLENWSTKASDKSKDNAEEVEIPLKNVGEEN